MPLDPKEISENILKWLNSVDGDTVSIDTSYPLDLHGNPKAVSYVETTLVSKIEKALLEAEKQGYNRGVEDAAKVAEGLAQPYKGTPWRERHKEWNEIASEIRSLRKS